MTSTTGGGSFYRHEDVSALAAATNSIQWLTFRVASSPDVGQPRGLHQAKLRTDAYARMKQTSMRTPDRSQ